MIQSVYKDQLDSIEDEEGKMEQWMQGPCFFFSPRENMSYFQLTCSNKKSGRRSLSCLIQNQVLPLLCSEVKFSVTASSRSCSLLIYVPSTVT
jgi:hypothetical protein